jgi:hypothetical protein
MWPMFVSIAVIALRLTDCHSFAEQTFMRGDARKVLSQLFYWGESGAKIWCSASVALSRSKFSAVCSEIGYLPKNRAKLQDNYNIFNECLRESVGL